MRGVENFDGRQTLRLAVDARNLVRPISGIGRSIAVAVEALAAAGNELHLHLPGPLHADFKGLQALPNCHLHADHAPGGAGRLLWGSTVLPRRVSAIRPDVIWAPAHRLSARLARVAPAVLTIHDLVWKFAPRTMLPHRRIGDRLMTARGLRHAARVTTVSARTAADLTAEFPAMAGKIAIVPNMVPARAAMSGGDSLAGLGVRPPFCLFVGTLEPRKNLARAVAAFRELPPSVRGDMRFVIAGARGWLTDETDRALAEDDGAVFALGPVDEAVLSDLYREAAFLVMPSLYEGFGYPAVEAQQFGKPVLTSKASPMAEIGEGAVVLVDPLDQGSIAEGLAACIEGRIGPVADRARANAACYRPEAVVPALMAVFNEARREWRR